MPAQQYPLVSRGYPVDRSLIDWRKLEMLFGHTFSDDFAPPDPLTMQTPDGPVTFNDVERGERTFLLGIMDKYSELCNGVEMKVSQSQFDEINKQHYAMGEDGRPIYLDGRPVLTTNSVGRNSKRLGTLGVSDRIEVTARIYHYLIGVGVDAKLFQTGVNQTELTGAILGLRILVDIVNPKKRGQTDAAFRKTFVLARKVVARIEDAERIEKALFCAGDTENK